MRRLSSASFKIPMKKMKQETTENASAGGGPISASGYHTNIEPIEKGVVNLQLQETFDKQLAYKLKVRVDSETAKKNYKFHRKFLSKMKYVVVALYIGIMPFIETPYWCLELNESKGD